jgi:hypothetical protein
MVAASVGHLGRVGVGGVDDHRHFGVPSTDPSLSEAAQRGVGETTANCSDALSSNYVCHQKRYQNLVRNSGVEAAFAELKDTYEKNDFVKSGCHQLVHVIGRSAAELYADLSTTYAQGDEFCGSGYYHGAMEVFATKIGADKMLDEADEFCADLGEHQRCSAHHRNCTHGLGHGFMGVLGNELFQSLETCDALTDVWERDHCYDGKFMQNTMAENDPNHPTKYLEADRSLYPGTEVEARYKNRCYQRQAGYALKTQGNDFARVFELCATAEEDSGQLATRVWGEMPGIKSRIALAMRL